MKCIKIVLSFITVYLCLQFFEIFISNFITILPSIFRIINTTYLVIAILFILSIIWNYIDETSKLPPYDTKK
ncbi:MAG: hypothetical protein ACRC41_12805 [Sarcina sp.]